MSPDRIRGRKNVRQAFCTGLISLCLTFGATAQASDLQASETKAVASHRSPNTRCHFSNGFVLESGRVTPDIPEEYAPDRDSGLGANYYIVYFFGPVRHRWLEQLAAIGAQPFGYLPRHAAVVRMGDGCRMRVAGLGFVAGVDLFQPVFKVEKRVLELEGSAVLIVVPFPEESLDSLAQAIERTGVAIAGLAGRTIRVRADRHEAARIARLRGVQWLQLADEPCLFNDNVQWVAQTGWQPVVPSDSTGRRIWHKGIRGDSIILSICDTGINTDHEMFADPALPIRAPGIYLNHDKVIAYKMYGNVSVFGDAGSFHGTRVTCTATGNDSVNGNRSVLDGVAPDARVYFLDLGNSQGSIFPDEDMTALVDSVHLGRGVGTHVLQYSQSWGWLNPSGGYGLQEASLDAACWRYPDFLVICASGNAVPKVAHPAAAKNVLTIGGCGNGIGSDSLYPGESRGPTADGRIKPDLVAPAIDVGSASGPGAARYEYSTGTSFAAPAVNGAAALARQYLAEGWFPAGTPDRSRAISNPSSALMRALAIVSADPNVDQPQHPVPDSMIGWGRMDLDSVLYFAGDERRLILYDNRLGLASQETHEYYVDVTSRIPLRATLGWTDTAAMPQAQTTLVNDLDLELWSPSSQYYRGNKYFLGQSSGNPLGWDSVNTLECFRLNRPDLGRWQIRVYARNVFTERQPFALAITGGCDSVHAIAEDRPKGELAHPLALTAELTPNPARSQVRISYSVPRGRASPPECVRLTVFDCSGRRVKDLGPGAVRAGRHGCCWNLIGSGGARVPAGLYFLKLEAGGKQITRKLAVAD
jgi:hypothetical protein